jgi:hypothetical protein
VACTAPQVPTRLASGQTICLFPTSQQQAVAAGATGISAPLIVHRFADGTVGYATGTVSSEDIAGAGSGALVRGVLGDVAPFALIAQQIALNAVVPGLYSAIANAAQQVDAAQRSNMGLNLANILGAAGQAISGVNTSGFGNISNIIGAGLNIASAAFTPQPSAQPTYGPAPQPVYQAMAPAIRAAGAVPMMVGATSLVAQITRPILMKIAATLGKRNMGLGTALGMIKRLGKVFSSPEAIAVYLGISVSEMAQLITAQASRKSRRMNPANTRALRRSLRRLKSFESEPN